MSDPIESIPLRDVAELLAAIRDALNVPQAQDHDDSRTEQFLREARIAWVIGATRALAGGESSPYIVAGTLASVRRAADHHPVTYTPYVPDPVAGALAEQRHQLYDPAVPPLAARQPSSAAPAREVAAVPLVGEAL
jgi:hypothetical protein